MELKTISIKLLKHRKKIETTRQEKIEEQRKIEERQGLIEARKEELRLRREKESEDIDRILGGAELLENTGDTRREFEDNPNNSRELV